MGWEFGMGRIRRAMLVLAAAAGLGACSGPPMAKPGETLGHGTPSVDSYLRDGQDSSLQAMLARCGRIPQAPAASQTQGLPAACAQLQRTLRNQPGNAVRPGRAP